MFGHFPVHGGGGGIGPGCGRIRYSHAPGKGRHLDAPYTGRERVRARARQCVRGRWAVRDDTARESEGESETVTARRCERRRWSLRTAGGIGTPLVPEVTPLVFLWAAWPLNEALSQHDGGDIS